MVERMFGRETTTNSSFCYRLEERKVFPGISIGKDQYGKETFYTDFYLIVEGSTEKYVDALGNKHKTSINIFNDGYFRNSDDAKKVAIQLHLLKNCSSKKCEWTKVVEEEKIKKEKRNYNTMFPMKYYQTNKP